MTFPSPLLAKRSLCAGRPLLLGLGAALVALSLSGCGGDPAPAYAQAFGFQCADHDNKLANKLCGRSNNPGQAKVSRYCYKTLGDANCFDRPDPDSKNQALGSSGS